MLEIKDRDAQLHELYASKNFWTFMTSEQAFYEQVKKIHWDWEQSGTWLKVTDDDIAISVICWEADKGY
jgi:hypothetical protein